MKRILCMGTLTLGLCGPAVSFGSTPAGDLADGLAEGWFKSGSNKAAYDVIYDASHGITEPLLTMTANKQVTQQGFGTVMKVFKPLDYLGKRVRLTAAVKSEDITGWAGLWIRVDDKEGKVLAFDNMQSPLRSITGTRKWAYYSIVFDVSEYGEKLAYGMILSGAGSISFGDFRFEVVDNSTPISVIPVKERSPKNMQF